MALKHESATKRYIGDTLNDAPRPGVHPLGTNPTPITQADLPPGSTFFNKEDWRIYRWDGSEWQGGLPDESTELLKEIVSELRLLREQVELIAPELVT